MANPKKKYDKGMIGVVLTALYFLVRFFVSCVWHK